MTIQAKLIRRLAELRIISRPVHVVTIEASYSAAVHNALDEIVSLHAVFVRGAIREIIEISRLANRVGFELPEILQFQSHMVADGPIVVFALDRI